MSKSPVEQVAAEVRAEMARQRRTQTELAAKMGHSQQWMSRRLTGVVGFDVDELLTVAQWLNVDVAVLLPEPVAS